MNKITKLTLEQESLLPKFREDARMRGLRLDWADESEIKQSVLNLYGAAGLTKPAVIVLDSPVACLIARAIILSISSRLPKIKEQLKDQFGDQLREQLGDQLREQLREQLWDQLREQLREQLWGQLWEQLGGQLGGQLWGQLREQLGVQLRGQLTDQIEDQLRGQLTDQIEGQLRGQLWEQLGGQLGGQLKEQLRGQLRGQLWEQLGDQLGDQLKEPLWFAGGSEFYWISFYRFCEVIGVKFSETTWLSCWEVYSQTAGCLYPYDGWAFVSRRPIALKFNDQKQLHCQDGPAMEFADGFSIYAFNGVRLPQNWVERRETIDPSEILKAENVEQRAAGAAMIGWPRMLGRLKHEIVDEGPNSDWGTLLRVWMPDLPQPALMLKAECPRNGTICEFVPEIGRSIDGRKYAVDNVLAAQASRVFKHPDNYIHPSHRT